MRALRWSLIAVAISSGLSWLAWILTVINTNPQHGGQSALLSFFISLGVALWGTLTLAGYGLRLFLQGNQRLAAGFRSALRQAGLLTAVLIALMLLQSLNLLAWWDILIVSFLALLLELYLQANVKTKPLR